MRIARPVLSELSVSGPITSKSVNSSDVCVNGQSVEFTKTYNSCSNSNSLPCGNIFVTMIGGGGLGGNASSTSGVYLGGGGGGAGEGCIGNCINLCSSGIWVANITIGHGGVQLHPDGEDTLLRFIDTKGLNPDIVLIASGGKGSVFNNGGLGGSGHFHKSFSGEDGDNGDIIYAGSNSNASGGKGGKSILTEYGTGGKGMNYGQPATRQNGKDGVVIIRF